MYRVNRKGKFGSRKCLHFSEKCDNISEMQTNVFAARTLRERLKNMEEKSKYFVVRDKALPEVLQKVVEVKRLLESKKSMTIQEAVEHVGLSRSSFYKYKDDILPFSDNTKGKTVTLVTQMNDVPGLLSDLLHVVSTYRANILTIHQTIPVNGTATVTLSVAVSSETGNVTGMMEEIEDLPGIHYVKILGVEK